MLQFNMFHNILRVVCVKKNSTTILTVARETGTPLLAKTVTKRGLKRKVDQNDECFLIKQNEPIISKIIMKSLILVRNHNEE